MSDLGLGGFGFDGGGCGRGITMLMLDTAGISKGGRVEGLEVVEKESETRDIGMIIGEILCLFLIQKFPLLLAPLSFYPFHC